jgi:hypothetical protein
MRISFTLVPLWLAASASSAMAGQPQSLEQRLLFDPAAIDRFSPPSIPSSPSARPATPSSAQNDGTIWPPDAVMAPDVSAALGGLETGSGASRPLNGPVARDGAAAPSRAFDSRFDLGKFSLGLETDSDFKPRTPFAGETNETGYDVTYDPKRTRPAMPFIGLSAKSHLP